MSRFPVRSIASLVLAGAVLAGCTDQAPTASEPEMRGPLADLSAVEAQPEAPGHLVVFRGQKGSPLGFAEQVAALGGTVEQTYPEVGIAFVRGLSAEGVASLEGSDDVLAVAQDQKIRTQVRGAEPIDAQMTDAELQSAAAPATAVLFSQQWNMRAIGADKAWAAGFLGSPNVTVAILDSGIDGTGLDLNGRVDLARSRSFTPEDDQIVKAVFPTRHVTTDLDGHGTNVASQVVSNAIGFAGVTSRTRLMSVKVCTVYGYCTVNAVLNGVLHAANNGADVINMSLGGGFMKRDCTGCVAVFNRILHYATRQGATVVVSAGNDSADLDHDGNFFNTYCSVSGVICVSATGPTASGATGNGPFPGIDTPAVYTNYGRSAISVAAPGGNYSANGVAWVYSLCSRTKLSYNAATGKLSYTSCSANPNLVYLSGYAGTSQASPHVSGLAALLVEKYGRNPARIATAIQQSADDLGQPGTDPFYGKGRINVARALGL